MGRMSPPTPAWCQDVEAINLRKKIVIREVTGDFFTLKPILEDVQGIRLRCSLPDHGLSPLGGHAKPAPIIARQTHRVLIATSGTSSVPPVRRSFDA